MLERRIRKQIEKVFYGYKSLLTQGAEHIVEVAESGLTSNLTASGHGSGISNPTEKKAMRLLNGNDSVRWCKVVEKTLEHFRDTGKDTLIRLKYFDNMSEWRLCDKLYVDRRTLFLWIEDILTYGVMWAIQENQIKLN